MEPMDYDEFVGALIVAGWRPEEIERIYPRENYDGQGSQTDGLVDTWDPESWDRD